MNAAEFQQIAKIIATADNGCIVCANQLAYKLKAAFPEFAWLDQVHEYIDLLPPKPLA